jgi:hypothetical protein
MYFVYFTWERVVAEYIDAQATATLSDPLKIYVLYVNMRVYLIFKRIFCQVY